MLRGIGYVVADRGDKDVSSDISWNCPRTEPSGPGFRGQRKASVRLSYALGDRLCQGFGRA